MTITAALALLAAASACPQGHVFPVIVTEEAEPPTVASTYRLDELRATARQVGHVGTHPVLGFYAATFGYSLETSAEGDCPSGTVIRLMLGARHVEVPSDAKAWGCRPEVLAEHYLLHAEADIASLGQLARQVQAAVDRLPGRPDQAPSASALASAVDDLLPAYDADRLKAFAASETGSAASHLRDACRGGMPGSL